MRFRSDGNVTRLTELTDGRVMCLVCLLYVQPVDLADDADVPGVKSQICTTCARGLDLYHLVMSTL